MRYTDGCYVSIPFINTKEDGDTERCWAHLQFRGNVDRRRVKRQIRKWVSANLQRHIHPEELRMLVRRVKTLD